MLSAYVKVLSDIPSGIVGTRVVVRKSFGLLRGYAEILQGKPRIGKLVYNGLIRLS